MKLPVLSGVGNTIHTADYTHSELFLTLTEPRVFIFRGGYKYFSNFFHLFCKQAITLSCKLQPEDACSVSPHFFPSPDLLELGGRQYAPWTGTEAYRITASFGHLAPLVYMSETQWSLSMKCA